MVYTCGNEGDISMGLLGVVHVRAGGKVRAWKIEGGGVLHTGKASPFQGTQTAWHAGRPLFTSHEARGYRSLLAGGHANRGLIAVNVVGGHIDLETGVGGGGDACIHLERATSGSQLGSRQVVFVGAEQLACRV